MNSKATLLGLQAARAAASKCRYIYVWAEVFAPSAGPRMKAGLWGYVSKKDFKSITDGWPNELLVEAHMEDAGGGENDLYLRLPLDPCDSLA